VRTGCSLALRSGRQNNFCDAEQRRFAPDLSAFEQDRKLGVFHFRQPRIAAKQNTRDEPLIVRVLRSSLKRWSVGELVRERYSF